MSEKIKIIFLGTSDAVPSAERSHTSILLIHGRENILVDCGEGAQRQFRKAKLNPCKITKLLITHWHGDHVLGIPGLIQTLALSKHNKPLQIYGPPGTKRFMENIMKTFLFSGEYPIEVMEVERGKFFDADDFFLEAKRMVHGIPCNAYSFMRKGKTRINKEKLKRIKLSDYSLLRKLKEGRDVVYKRKKYSAKDLTYKEEDRKISFVLDTSMNEKIAPFVKNSDLLICESTFDSESQGRAKEYLHLTAKQAAQIAKKSGSKKLLLTHISQRYGKDRGKILKEARNVFKNSFLVKDLDAFQI